MVKGISEVKSGHCSTNYEQILMKGEDLYHQADSPNRKSGQHGCNELSCQRSWM